MRWSISVATWLCLGGGGDLGVHRVDAVDRADDILQHLRGSPMCARFRAMFSLCCMAATAWRAPCLDDALNLAGGIAGSGARRRHHGVAAPGLRSLRRLEVFPGLARQLVSIVTRP